MQMQYLVIISCLASPFYAAGSVRECWHCFSEKSGNCENPYKGRYGPNSTILKPDCSYDMAHAFHATVIYVLSTASMIEEIGANDSSKWVELDQSPVKLECCKTEMEVHTYEGVSKSLVVRGCCTSPSIYDQCAEIESLCREMTGTLKGPNGTINHSSCKITHCSRCQYDCCNAAKTIVEVPSFIVPGIIIYLGFFEKCGLNYLSTT